MGVLHILSNSVFLNIFSQLPANQRVKEKRYMKTEKRTNFLKGIKFQLLMMSILPLLIASVVSIVTAVKNMESGLQNEALSRLKSVCISLKASYDTLNDDDYFLDSTQALNGNSPLVKGDYNITSSMEDLDAYVEGTNVEITLFYGDTRKATTLIDASTGDRMVDTKASEEVARKVLGGEEYTATKLAINGENYYAYYLPLENPDGSIVGMVFAGAPSSEIDSFIAQRCGILIGVTVVIGIVMLVIIVIISTNLVKAIDSARDAVDSLAQGNLTYKVDEKAVARKDEIGDMARGVAECIDRMRSTIGGIKSCADELLSSGEELETMSQQTSHNADNINSTVADLSTGAMSLAEDIESATLKIDEMGVLIENIVSNIGNLNENSAEMASASKKVFEIMRELDESSQKMTDAVFGVAKNVAETDDAVKRISDAVSMIMSVASQTNLLSLNASIEAARAGEAGRGFAVVATEIQKLSEESNKSAQLISEIIATLSEASQNSLKMMDEVKVRISEQQENLNATKNQVEGMNDGIRVANEGVTSINEQAKGCDAARGGVIDIIQSLSAISQENAASTEQASSSMNELSQTITTVAESSAKLKDLAVSLDGDTKFFNIEG